MQTILTTPVTTCGSCSCVCAYKTPAFSAEPPLSLHLTFTGFQATGSSPASRQEKDGGQPRVAAPLTSLQAKLTSLCFPLWVYLLNTPPRTGEFGEYRNLLLAWRALNSARVYMSQKHASWGLTGREV